MSLSWTVYLDPTRAAGTSLITAAGRPARMQQWVAGDTISLRIALMDVAQSTPVLIDFDGSTVTVSGIQRSGGDMLFLGTLAVDESGAIGTVSLNTSPLADLLPNGSGKSAVVTAEVTWVGADGPQSVQWPVEILAQVTDSETVPEPLGEWPASADVWMALSTTIPAKMDKTPGAAGDLLDTDAQGNARRSGVTTTAVSTALATTIPSKMDKTPGAAGDLLDTDAQGNARRSGLTTAAVATALSTTLPAKMDKVPGADFGKIAIFDGADGSIGVSVSSPEDFIARQPGAAGQLPELLEDGSLFQSGILSSAVATALSTTLPAKMDKTPGAAGAILDTDANGNARRSGVTTSAVSTALIQVAGSVRHDTAQSLTDAARDTVLANIGTGLKYSVLNAVGKKALMRAALLASGQAVHIYLNSTSAFASFALIPAATTPPTLMKSMSPIGLDTTFEAGFEEHSALFRFGVAYGNSGTAGAGAGVMHIAAANQTTVQVPCSFADGAYGSLTLTCADASTVVIRSLYTSKSTEYLWLRIGARSGGVKPVYVYDYATSAWKLLINCPSTSDGFRHPQFGFVLGAGFGSCYLKHDNLHGSLVYPSAISISDIF